MPLKSGASIPTLESATEWLNGAPDVSAFEGFPVLIHFWAVSCHYCHNAFPTIIKWREEFEPQGLKIISIHMPRQETDTDVDRVRADAKAMNLTEPIGIDNLHKVGGAFENEYIPAYFLFDREGKLKGRSAGDTGVSLIEHALRHQFE